MTQRKKSRRSKNNNKTFYTNIIVLLLMISFFLMVVLKDKMGIIGSLVAKAFFIVFGMTAYVAPILILYYFFAFRKKLINANNLKKNISFFLLFINAMVILAIIFDKGGIYNARISNSYELAKGFSGAGAIGVSLHFVLEKLIGNVGIYVLTVANLFFAYLSFFGMTFSSLVHEASDKLKDAKLKREKKQFEKKQEKYLPKVVDNKVKDGEFEIDQEDFSNSKQTEPYINYYRPISEDESFDESYEKEHFEEDGNGQVVVPNLGQDDSFNYEKPPIELLAKSNTKFTGDSQELLKENGSKIVNTLASFGIDVEVVNINSGPTVTSYELKPEAGIKVSKIVNLSNDLSLALATTGIRIEAPIPGKPYVGIEVPNVSKDTVSLRDLFVMGDFDTDDNDLTVALGKNLFGKPIYAKINEMPHILIAGATGSGKSVCINTIIMSLIFKYSPEDVEFIMIDPKRVELSVYNGIPHLKGRKVVYDSARATNSLEYAVREMVDRYEKFAKSKVRDIASYNELMKERQDKKMPFLVVIVDELSDLMMESSKEVENHITRLAQMGRAAGIHLIIATQRPSVDVITGVIKANIPSRISFQVSSAIDSRTILDISGAEKLLGKGDMLYYPAKFPKPMRVQGAFVADKEVERVVAYIKNQNDDIKTDVSFNEAIEPKNGGNNGLDEEDDLLQDAIEFVIREQQGSISAIQRRFSVGYNRAGRIIDQMEKLGIVGKHEGSKPRKILKDLSYLTQDKDMQEKDDLDEGLEDEFSQ
ncbi:MAG: DNA translocase FtsK 4TM domain-containing protein [Tissierellia bacterium]|nr:DNA translocase FtsK 4TM domain-containing protein [Tissierellia bacterium]